MKLSGKMKLAIAGIAALGVYAYAKSQNKCPNGGTWKATATGGYCAAAECPDCVSDAGTQSLSSGGIVSQVTGALSGLGNDLGHALGNLFGSSPTVNPGSGPITSPDDPRLVG